MSVIAVLKIYFDELSGGNKENKKPSNYRKNKYFNRKTNDKKQWLVKSKQKQKETVQVILNSEILFRQRNLYKYTEFNYKVIAYIKNFHFIYTCQTNLSFLPLDIQPHIFWTLCLLFWVSFL